MIFSRAWEMPNADTFSVFPIGRFVQKYLSKSTTSVDPFARNCEWATHRNDLNPDTKAPVHMDALDFLDSLRGKVGADLVLFDPPYSPRQVSECYASVGRAATMADTQSSFWTKLRDSIDHLVAPGGTVLSFGWNSNGMGIGRGYRIEEILIVAHGGAHNDTICMAETKVPDLLSGLV